MRSITVKLSTQSIDRAIMRLIEMQDNLDRGVEQLVEILTEEGADMASASYGGMADVEAIAFGNEGVISASGEAVGFAEFGAGDDVVPVNFEGSPDFPVYPGSYSETEGSGEYAATGKWHFGGQTFHGVPARMGLLNAKEFIIQSAPYIAKEVIRL